MVTARQVIRNSIWSALAFGISFGVSILLAFILPHMLGKEEYGRYGYYFRIFSWINAISILFVPPALLRYGSELRGYNNTLQLRKLLRWGYKYQLWISITVTFGAVLYLWQTEFSDSSYLTASILVLLSGFISGFHLVGRSYLEANQRFRLCSRITLWSSIVKLTVLVLLFFSGAQKAYCFFSIILAEHIVLLVLTLYANLLYNKTKQGEMLEGKKLNACEFSGRVKDYGLTMGAAGLFSMVAWGYIEVFFIKQLYSKEDMLSELSYYCLAVSISTLMLRVLNNINKPLLTFFVHHKVTDRGDVVEKGFMKSLIIFTMTGGAGCIFLYLFSGELFDLVFPVEMAKARLPFIILLVPSFILCMLMPLGPLQQAYEAHKFLLWINVIAAILNLTLDMLLIPEYGAVGAAIVNSVVQTSISIGGVIYLQHKKILKLPVGGICRLFCCFALLILSVNCLKSIVSSLVLLVLAFLMYPVLLVIFNCVRYNRASGKIVVNY